MARGKLTVLVCGMVGAADPHQGGATWAVLQYALGLRKLGHEVHVVEPVASWDGAEGVRYFQEVTAEFGLNGASAVLRQGTRETAGLSYDELSRLARRVDLLLNVNGLLADSELFEPIPVRVYLDIDPGFNQLWHATQGIDRRFEGHSHHVTIGLGIGEPGCAVPTCGIDWLKTLQPVVLDEWPVAGPITHDALTTIGNWRGYGSFEHEGVFYGQKAHSLRRFVTLPTRTSEQFLLALAIHSDERRDLDALARNGWRVEDPLPLAGTPAGYRRFVQGSKAEFGLAKDGYVAAGCGWFSDRSACYLASGRPVIAQETGFSRFLPTGDGLFAFETEEDVLSAIEEVNRDYPRHSRAARAIAEEHFDSDTVLRELLAQVGVG